MHTSTFSTTKLKMEETKELGTVSKQTTTSIDLIKETVDENDFQKSSDQEVIRKKRTVIDCPTRTNIGADGSESIEFK